jgi:hypothetical protein
VKRRSRRLVGDPQAAPAKYREWIGRKETLSGFAVIRADVDIRRIFFDGLGSVDVEQESPGAILSLDLVHECSNGLTVLGIKRARRRGLGNIERTLFGPVRIDELPMILSNHYVGRLANSLEQQLSDCGCDLPGKAVAN